MSALSSSTTCRRVAKRRTPDATGGATRGGPQPPAAAAPVDDGGRADPASGENTHRQRAERRLRLSGVDLSRGEQMRSHLFVWFQVKIIAENLHRTR